MHSPSTWWLPATVTMGHNPRIVQQLHRKDSNIRCPPTAQNNPHGGTIESQIIGTVDLHHSWNDPRSEWYMILYIWPCCYRLTTQYSRNECRSYHDSVASCSFPLVGVWRTIHVVHDPFDRTQAVPLKSALRSMNKKKETETIVFIGWLPNPITRHCFYSGIESSWQGRMIPSRIRSHQFQSRFSFLVSRFSPWHVIH